MENGQLQSGVRSPFSPAGARSEQTVSFQVSPRRFGPIFVAFLSLQGGRARVRIRSASQQVTDSERREDKLRNVESCS